MISLRAAAVLLTVFGLSFPGHAQVPDKSVIATGWQMQYPPNVAHNGDQYSQVSFDAKDWLKATVPGTVLTTLVDNGVYPEPLYGENNRPDKIPESLSHANWYWYRAVFPVPAAYAGKKIWLNFDGTNYSTAVWVNGKAVGTINGAFVRGIMDITPFVEAGKNAAVAVRVSPQFHPGIPAEHTIGAGNGPIGGITRIDGPTFACSIGWDWIPGIRDRDTGIWQKVFLSATGPVVIKDPQITTDLPLPRIDSADVTVAATVQNVTDQPEKCVLKGNFGDVSFEKPVELAARTTQTVTFDSKAFPQLHVANPKLWWPNGYGAPNLYKLHLSVDAEGAASDAHDVSFGIRKITYDVPGTDALALSVNGVRVFCKGGDWGMDEALKRIPRERLEAQIRLHQLANYTMIRNWGGQSTSDDLYDLCDKYGILLWDEFFQFNNADPGDLGLYMANCRDKILRYRNHPSVAVWCGRNENYPPPYLDDALRNALTELDPQRWYQSNSGGGRGANSGGPYDWTTPTEYYLFSESKKFNKKETFKTEIGAISIPTIESIKGMMPEKDWYTVNDDWAEHDFMAGGGRKYPALVEKRYGKIANLADFVRKGQMMNYEAYRAMYEGRQAQLFNPVQGILTWMSHPAQPSFVWQIYHYDLEPNACLFAVRKACEQIHIQFNETDGGTVQVINNLPTALAGAKAHLVLYNLDGIVADQKDYDVTAAPSAATTLGAITWPTTLSPVHFVKLELHDSAGKLLSDGLYWRAIAAKPDDLTALDGIPVVTLDIKTARHDADGKMLLDVTLKNPGQKIALMTHLQLRRGTSKDRVLPVFCTDNYISLAPKEEKTVTIEAALSDLKGEKPLVLVDGWNIAVNPVSSTDAEIALNKDAQIDSEPKNGLPFYYAPIAAGEEVRINCGGFARDGFQNDPGGPDGGPGYTTDDIDMNTPNAAPKAIYQTCWWGEASYAIPLKTKPGQAYTVRLHFAELAEKAPGKRLFNVLINGKQVLTDFDVFKETGALRKALVKEFPGITPDDKSLITVAVTKGKTNSPEINGIEVLKNP